MQNKFVFKGFKCWGNVKHFPLLRSIINHFNQIERHRISFAGGWENNHHSCWLKFYKLIHLKHLKGWTSYTSFNTIITKLFMLLNLFVHLGNILGGLALTSLILSEPDLKMATFVQPSSCGGGDKRLCEGLWTTELQWQVQMTFYFPFYIERDQFSFFPPSNQSVRSQFIGFELGRVMCSALKLWSDVSSLFFCIQPAPSHSLSICMATLYQASCCCPFLSSCWILIITFKGKRLQSSFIKCLYWEEASPCPTPTLAALLLLNISVLLVFQLWRQITYGRKR